MAERAVILVVEDDPLVSEVIAAALDDEYSISVVETASEALTRVQAGGIRLMLLDCTLPGGVDADRFPRRTAAEHRLCSCRAILAAWQNYQTSRGRSC